MPDITTDAAREIADHLRHGLAEARQRDDHRFLIGYVSSFVEQLDKGRTFLRIVDTNPVSDPFGSSVEDYAAASSALAEHLGMGPDCRALV